MTRPRPAARVLVAVALCGLGACASSKDAASSAPPSGASAAPAKQVASTAAPAAMPPPPAVAAGEPASLPRAAARVAEAQGEVRINARARPLTTSELVPQGALLAVPKGGKLALDLENGARMTLDGGALAVLPFADLGTLVLVRGNVKVSAAGQALDPRMSLRVAAETFSAQAPGGSVEAQIGPKRLVVTSGALDLETLAEEPTTTRVLAAKDAKLAALSADDRSALATTFDTLRGQLVTERMAQETDSSAQRAAHAANDADRVSALQAQIVARATRVIALKRRLRASYERRLAALAAEHEPSDLAAIARLASQYASVVNRAD